MLEAVPRSLKIALSVLLLVVFFMVAAFFLRQRGLFGKIDQGTTLPPTTGTGITAPNTTPNTEVAPSMPDQGNTPIPTITDTPKPPIVPDTPPTSPKEAQARFDTIRLQTAPPPPPPPPSAH